MIKRKYLCKKDLNVEEEHHHTFSILRFNTEIKEVDLRKGCPPVYDQGELGSCTANGLAACYEYDEMKENEKNTFTPSRLFIYYNERVVENSVNDDAGAQIYDGIKVLNSVGVCPESMWPYDILKFKEKPIEECYNIAKNHKTKTYKKIPQILQQLKQCLINKNPIVFGISVYDSFESEEVAKSGMIPMPKPNEKLQGGHCVSCFGFSDEKQCFLVRNSWGVKWAIGGYCWLPYAYMTDKNLSSDFWTIIDTVDIDKK